MTFDWNLTKTFLATVDEGSLSAAARALGQTQPTISRQIAALEASLNVTLFVRTGRSVELTQSGVDLLEHVRAMNTGANMVSLVASGQSQLIAGQVRITASELMSAYVLPQLLEEISFLAPSLQIDVVADNSVKDLVRREADIAIRHVRPDQPNLLTRRIRDDVMRFYASPAYLRNRGQPRKADIGAHQIISFVAEDRMLSYLRPIGLDLTSANFRLNSSSQLVALEMARRGLGMIIAPEWVAQGHSDLLPVLEEVEAFSIPTWLVTHSEMKTSRRIRLVFDHLVDKLS